MEDLYLVDFELHCKKCKHRNKEEWEYPCSECIPVGARACTRVPLHYDGPRLIEKVPSTKEKLKIKSVDLANGGDHTAVKFE